MSLPISSRAVTLVAAAGVAIASLLLLLPSPATAYGSYASATGQPCAACHVNPAGGGQRTHLGRAFEAIPTHFNDPAGAWTQVSAPVSPTATPAPDSTVVPAEVPTTAPTDVPMVTLATSSDEEDEDEEADREQDDRATADRPRREGDESRERRGGDDD